jgi:hypothetical protein
VSMFASRVRRPLIGDLDRGTRGHWPPGPGRCRPDDPGHAADQRSSGPSSPAASRCYSDRCGSAAIGWFASPQAGHAVAGDDTWRFGCLRSALTRRGRC